MNKPKHNKVDKAMYAGDGCSRIPLFPAKISAFFLRRH